MHWETKKNETLYCDIHFTVVVWSQTCNISKVCLCSLLVQTCMIHVSLKSGIHKLCDCLIIGSICIALAKVSVQLQQFLYFFANMDFIVYNVLFIYILIWQPIA